VCANVIDETKPCPGTSTGNFAYSPYNSSICRQSDAFYDPMDVFHTPYYGCCVYAEEHYFCYYSPAPGQTATGDMGRKLFFRYQSSGAASCLNGQCINQ